VPAAAAFHDQGDAVGRMARLGQPHPLKTLPRASQAAKQFSLPMSISACGGEYKRSRSTLVHIISRWLPLFLLYCVVVHNFDQQSRRLAFDHWSASCPSENK